MPQDTKRSKSSVDYGPGHAGGERCGICAHFQMQNDPDHPTCEVVVGHVRARDWCKLFTSKGR